MTAALLGIGLLMSAAAKPPAPCSVSFEDVAPRSGLSFLHERGASEAHRLAETIGSGVAWLDFDNDGWLDLFVVQSGKLPEGDSGRLFRNNGNGSFTDVTAKAGLGTKIFGMGAAAADYDNDGFTDLYVTGYGRNVLYHNNGDGTFSDVTDRAGVRGSAWSTSAAWADFDGDGLLDLVVARYVDTTPEPSFFCGDRSINRRDYCDPQLYPPAPMLLFHNNGDGTFRDILESSGVAAIKGKSLGIVASDLDGDGRPDIYVANDTMINFLFKNLGSNRFEDASLTSGAGVNLNGRPQGGMGVEAGDLDGDGRIDLVVTNFESEINSNFRNLGDLVFEDASASSGFGGASFAFSGFGLNLADFGNRGSLDAFVANGHVLDHPKLQVATRAERPFLMWNDGRGHFEERGCGAPFARPLVGRGSAAGDFDNDGFPDLAVSNSGGPLELLHNGGNSNAWIGVQLRGTRSNREGIGAFLILETDRGTQVREVKSGGSYLSSGDPRVLFGLGNGARVRKLEIRWPSGARQTVVDLPLRRYTRITESESPPPAIPR
ncbi:MAG: CRTAC1 family protein [Thermoanaerobaculia bacterium]